MYHSIVLTVYNAPNDVILCLKSLSSSLDFSCVQLIIVDDASKKETQKILNDFAAEHRNIILVRHEENQGYLHSVNDGIKYAQGDIITLLNSDTFIPCDFTSRILACFEHDKTIGVASPVLSHGNPFSVPLICHQLNQKKDIRMLSSLVEDMNNKAKNILPDYPDIVFPDGACFSISHNVLESIGNFNEAYSPGYFEELEFCMRAHQKGFRCVLIENLYVYHKSHASFGKRKTNVYMKQNQNLFYTHWGNEYIKLLKKFPKKCHKKRIFCSFYPFWYYVFVESLLSISRIIPIRSIRRKIRLLYQ